MMADSFNVAVRKGIVVEGGILRLYDTEVKGYRIDDELGRGANGVVFLAWNSMLSRQEALKVWFPSSTGDKRDKIQQGIQEVTKLAAVNGKHAVQIFNAWIEGPSVVACMEYIKGETLQAFCKRVDDIGQRIAIAYAYLSVIEQTTTPSTRHGDPHWKNVLLFTEPDGPHDDRTALKLCDFGTSQFSGKESSEQRHWSIVKETVLRLTDGFPDRTVAEERIAEFEAQLRPMIEGAATKPDKFKPYDVARMRAASLRDYLDFWDSYFRGFKAGQVVRRERPK